MNQNQPVPSNERTTVAEQPGELTRLSSLLYDQEELLRSLRGRLGDVIVSSKEGLNPPPNSDRGMHVAELSEHVARNNDNIRQILSDLAI